MAFSFFTWGGLFYWADRYAYAGWRIQECIWTKRCRLLDPYQIRRATGSFEACHQKLSDYLKDWEIPAPPSKAVVFIHGLFQTPYAFEKIARRFSGDYEIMMFSYPMLRFDVAKSADVLNKFLDRRSDTTKVNFIAAGTGGLILRRAAGENPGWLSKIGRSVFIAVPSKGYRQAEKYKGKWWFRRLFGQAVDLLVPGTVAAKIPPMVGEFSVIIAGKEDNSGILPFFKTDNDGLLCVEDARDERAKEEFLALNRTHFSLLKDDQVIELAYSFIRSGRFGTGKRIRKEQILTNLWDN